MIRESRPRHYVSPAAMIVLRPLLRYSYSRQAYILRLVGESRGPVLRENQRRRHNAFGGPERRGALIGAD